MMLGTGVAQCCFFVFFFLNAVVSSVLKYPCL